MLSWIGVGMCMVCVLYHFCFFIYIIYMSLLGADMYVMFFLISIFLIHYAHGVMNRYWHVCVMFSLLSFLFFYIHYIHVVITRCWHICYVFPYYFYFLNTLRACTYHHDSILTCVLCYISIISIFFVKRTCRHEYMLAYVLCYIYILFLFFSWFVCRHDSIFACMLCYFYLSFMF
jgi:hypothetical protein